jgi:dTDP-4-amino-4,6-dideoxygalactose transaminase
VRAKETDVQFLEREPHTCAVTSEMIPHSIPSVGSLEVESVVNAISLGKILGDGPFTSLVKDLLEGLFCSSHASLTTPCTSALDMSAILLDIQPGVEVVMPSYTFVSTADAFVLRGGVAVFVDIRPDTLNIDETKIGAAITSKTRAIVPVHYAGLACDMDVIMDTAKRHNLYVVEDAAQAIMFTYMGKNWELSEILVA